MWLLLCPLAIIWYAKKHTTHLEFSKLLMWFAQKKRLKEVGGRCSVWFMALFFLLLLPLSWIIDSCIIVHWIHYWFYFRGHMPICDLKWAESESLSLTLLESSLCLLPLVPFYVHDPGEIPSVMRAIRKQLHLFLCFIRIRCFNKKERNWNHKEMPNTLLWFMLFFFSNVGFWAIRSLLISRINNLLLAARKRMAVSNWLWTLCSAATNSWHGDGSFFGH